LEPQDVAVTNGSVGKALAILDLASTVLVMELVAERSAIRAVRGKLQFLNQNRDNLAARSVVREFGGNTLVLC
jgi:hypothetical protein